MGIKEIWPDGEQQPEETASVAGKLDVLPNPLYNTLGRRQSTGLVPFFGALRARFSSKMSQPGNEQARW